MKVAPESYLHSLRWIATIESGQTIKTTCEQKLCFGYGYFALDLEHFSTAYNPALTQTLQPYYIRMLANETDLFPDWNQAWALANITQTPQSTHLKKQK